MPGRHPQHAFRATSPSLVPMNRYAASLSAPRRLQRGWNPLDFSPRGRHSRSHGRKARMDVGLREVGVERLRGWDLQRLAPNDKERIPLRITAFRPTMAADDGRAFIESRHSARECSPPCVRRGSNSRRRTSRSCPYDDQRIKVKSSITSSPITFDEEALRPRVVTCSVLPEIFSSV